MTDPRRPPAPSADLRLEVPGGPRAVPAARQTVAGLSSYIHAEALNSVLLLVSELVTNAIRHGGADAASSLQLELTVKPQAIRVEVRDPGDGLRIEPTADREGGWGLVLLDGLADRWGIEREPRHTVWFEIDRGSGVAGHPIGRKDS